MTAMIFGALPVVTNPANYAAFGRLRVANPETVFDSKLVYDNQPILWTEQIVAPATSVYLQSDARVRLTTGAGVNSVIRQTKAYLPYSPGKGALIFVTFNMNGAIAGVTKEAGYNDAVNGILLQTLGTTVNIVRRSGSSVPTVTVPQASWNIDQMTGSGPSRQTLDLTKTQLLVIDFSWLGVGSVRVGFFMQGQIFYVHQFITSNIDTAVYTSTPDLPIRYSISTATGVVSTLDCICATAMSEGGAKGTGLRFSFIRTAITGVVAAAGIGPVISIRTQPSTAFTRIPAIPSSLSILATGAANGGWELRLNPTTLTVATFAAQVGTSLNGYLDVDTAATVVAGGTVLASGTFSSTERVANFSGLENTFFRLGSSVDGTTPGVLTLVAHNFSGGGETYRGSIGWLAQV